MKIDFERKKKGVSPQRINFAAHLHFTVSVNNKKNRFLTYQHLYVSSNVISVCL